MTLSRLTFVYDPLVTISTEEMSLYDFVEFLIQESNDTTETHIYTHVKMSPIAEWSARVKRPAFNSNSGEFPGVRHVL